MNDSGTFAPPPIVKGIMMSILEKLLAKRASKFSKSAADGFIESGRAGNPYINIARSDPESFNQAVYYSQWPQEYEQAYEAKVPMPDMGVHRMNWALEDLNNSKDQDIEAALRWYGATGYGSEPYPSGHRANAPYSYDPSREQVIRHGYRYGMPLEEINERVVRGDALASKVLPDVRPGAPKIRPGLFVAQRTQQNRPAPSLVDRFANVKFPWDKAGQSGSTDYRTNARYVYGDTAGNALADGLSTGVSALRKAIR